MHRQLPSSRSAFAPANGWQRMPLPEVAGRCHADRCQLEPGLVLVHSDYQPQHDLAEENANLLDARVLVITFGLQGDSVYQSRDGGQLPFRGGHTTMSGFRHSIGQRRYAAGARVAQLRLLIEESVLARYLGEPRCRDLLPANGVRQLAFGPTAGASNVHIDALLRQRRAAPATAGLNTLDLQIHTLSLLAEQLRGLKPHAAPTPTAGRRWPEREIAKIEQVRELMHTHMAQALTVSWLCATVGISEFKLKAGCALLYQRSPYQLLLEIRMRHAWTLLEGGCQVAQAAWQTGYEHPSSFSVAFTRFFGRTPKSVNSK